MNVHGTLPPLELEIVAHSEVTECAPRSENIRCLLIEAPHEDEIVEAYRSQLTSAGWLPETGRTHFSRSNEVFRQPGAQQCRPFVQFTAAAESRFAPANPHTDKVAYILVYSADVFCVLRRVPMDNQRTAPQSTRQ